MEVVTLTSPVFAANCLVISHEGRAVVVDPGAGTAQRIARHLTQHGLALAAVLATHGHPDHVWDAAAVAGSTPVLIAAPDVERLRDPAGDLGPDLAAMFAEMAGGPWQVPANIVPFVPGEAVDPAPGLTLHTFGAPGHTPGSMLAVLDAPAAVTGPMSEGTGLTGTRTLVLTGDVIFAGSVGRTDLPGGDPAAMRRTLAELPPRLPHDAVLLPGHGPATALSHERATNPFLPGARGVG